jgi:apolipoprotein D and lipocalin family protein
VTYVETLNAPLIQTTTSEGITGFSDDVFANHYFAMFYASAVLCSLFAFSSATNTTLGVDTVNQLDVSKYVGRWYQMYADQLVYSTIEPNAQCVTADYAAKSDGTISVHNYQTTGSPNSGFYTIDGYAYVPNAAEPGQLKVHFDSVGGADAPYWVLELGPVNSAGFYDWSIVSDPFAAYLFVLARNVDTFNSQYDAEVTAKLKDLGFTKKSNSPIPTYQGKDCVYESL